MNLLFGRWTFVALQAALLAVAVLAFLRLSEAKASRDDSNSNLHVCQQLVDEIEQLRGLSSIANDQTEATGISNASVLEFAKQVGMTELHVTSMQRLPPTPIVGTDYERHDLALQLTGVSMEQVVRFVLVAEQQCESAKATSLSLRSVTGKKKPFDAPREQWNAQLTLTQLVYLARSAPRL